jgi:hypothetical protein
MEILKQMNKDKLKLIIKNLELLIQSLKEEIYSDTSTYNRGNINILDDYDEIFEDEDD